MEHIIETGSLNLTWLQPDLMFVVKIMVSQRRLRYLLLIQLLRQMHIVHV